MWISGFFINKLIFGCWLYLDFFVGKYHFKEAKKGMEKVYDACGKINSYIAILEKIVICFLVFLMVLLSFSEVALRSFFQMGFLWIKPVLRVDLLWITFVGASLATYVGMHISVDVVARFLSGIKRKVVDISASVFLFFACIFFFLAGLNYVFIQYTSKASYMLPGLPDWIVMLIMPYFFIVTSFRSLITIMGYILNKQIDKDQT